MIDLMVHFQLNCCRNIAWHSDGPRLRSPAELCVGMLKCSTGSMCQHRLHVRWDKPRHRLTIRHECGPWPVHGSHEMHGPGLMHTVSMACTMTSTSAETSGREAARACECPRRTFGSHLDFLLA